MKKVLLALAVVAGFAACGKTEEGGSTAQASSAVTAEARSLFEARCASCHGAGGKGDGPAAAALTPKPRDYTDAAWQASVTDEQIAKTIVEGGAAVGKSPLMPPAPDLKDQPDQVKGLVAVVRSYKQ